MYAIFTHRVVSKFLQGALRLVVQGHSMVRGL